MTVHPEERFRQLALLFQEAVTLPPGTEREAWLDTKCGGDAGLREEVVRLLASDAAVRRRGTPAPSPLPRFGIYQARELIGAGGMGAVYLATREDGEVRQRVAVKAIASPYHSPLLEDRLRSERQILAELYHPNIAAFLGGGVTGEGFSYLVMEYVEGERIDTWCDSRCLSIERRLHLFLKVSAAVSFAHQRLIVHRDLKPGNVLVTPAGEPKLLDFGIARTLEADGDSAQATSNFFLTPLYASPEVLRNQAVSVAADVYSLGVLLYQLLNGECPFGASGTTPADIIQAVLSSDAPALSHGVTGEGAAARGMGAAALARLLRGDLEAIAAKALARSPADRYASVEQFADDILRYLDGHPVQAASRGRLYRARKFVTRHKSVVATVTLVTLSLVAGLVATLWEARVAERRFADAHELAHYLQYDLRKSVAKLPGSTPVEADMARHSLDYLDRLSAQKIHDPVLRTEVGEGYADLGAVLGSPFQPNLGETGKARDSFRKAIAILEPLAAKDPTNLRARVSLARSKLELGRSIGFGGSAPAGLRLVEEAAREFDGMAARRPADFEVRSQAAIAFQSLATAVSANNGYVNAQNLDAGLAAMRKAIDNATAAARLHPGIAEVLISLGSNYKRMGDLTELRDRPAATAFFRQARAVLDQIPEKERDTPQARNARSSALLGLGWNLGNLGDFTASLAALEEARQIRDRMSAEDPANIMALYFRAIPYRDLGIVSGYAGHPDAKLRYFLIAIEIYDRLMAKNPANQAYRFAQAELQSDAADLSAGVGRSAEALRLAQAGLRTLKEIASGPQASPVELAIAARALLETKVTAMADPKLGLELAKRAAALDPRDSEVQEILGEAYWLNRDRQSAVEAIEQALALIEPAPTPTRRALEKTLAQYRGAP
ncbi:MAG: protein kinase [Bryobacteraceae bacterium]|jgi:non-specific serine/threonine protein kinase/serine/threonine-protein kinase